MTGQETGEPPHLVIKVIASVFISRAWVASLLEAEEVKGHLQLESSENVLGKYNI